MKREPFNLSKRYRMALQGHLDLGPEASLDAARGLGSRAVAAGLPTLELAQIHEQFVVTEILPTCPPELRASRIKQAGVFFAAAMAPVGPGHDQAQQALESLSQRTVELAAANSDLLVEIAQRKALENSLKAGEVRYRHLLEGSDRRKEQLRQLSRQLLAAHEDERRKISRELHDVIAQTLTGISLRLATLKEAAERNTKDLSRNISRTQRLVEKSVTLVHQFACELRPAVLDDLGLIPALHTFLKELTARTGIRTRLTAIAVVEQVDMAYRTVLFRVAQEAMTNIVRHAAASQAKIRIEQVDTSIVMIIEDDGKSFDVPRILQAKGRRRLGLLGMQERLEMVGGSFAVESTPGKGTTITAHIPCTSTPAKTVRRKSPVRPTASKLEPV